MTFKISTKAKTLSLLQKKNISAKVLPIIKFYVKDYKKNRDEIINQCLNKFEKKIIIRSSSINEDNSLESNAGKFETIMNVSLDADEINNAISKVINSYNSQNDKDEVLIQPMLEQITMSGVVFTADLDTLAAYYIINYDTSGSTSSVTSGNTNNLKTLITHKSYKLISDKKIKKILEMANECENLFFNNFLDIEFAYSADELYILQVRTIVKKNKNDLSHINLKKSLNKLYKKIEKLNSSHPKLLGNKSIFGVMPDWNPAEIIGVKPKRLALSLYKELITDETWAYQRNNYGYRNLRSFPLLVSFLGVPFIDVRVSFNSFIPKNLDNKIANKLINYYLDKLSENKKYHDKIEFKIIYSCFFFGISDKLKNLEHIFSENEISEIESSLLQLTNKIINIKDGLYVQDIKKIETLKKHYNDITSSSLSIIDKIYWLIHDCKRYGT